MAKMGEITVEVKPRLTVDNDTAYVCLGLLEMYCRQNGKTIEARYTRKEDEADFEVTFDFSDDEKLEKMKRDLK